MSNSLDETRAPWSTRENRDAPLTACEAFAHQLHDDAFALFQACRFGDARALAHVLDRVETCVRLCRKAAKSDGLTKLPGRVPRGRA